MVDMSGYYNVHLPTTIGETLSQVYLRKIERRLDEPCRRAHT